MESIKEENIAKFKEECQYRFSPNRITGFMIGIMIYVSIIMFFSLGTFVRFGWDYYTTPLEKIIVGTEFVLYGLQVLFLVIYSIPRVAFKLQKLQPIVFLLYLFQLGTVGFTIFILPALSEYYSNTTTQIYVGLLILGAVVVHVISAVDIFKQVKEGKRNSSFSEKKDSLIKEIGIYALIILGLIYLYNFYDIDTMIMYAVFTVIMYIIAIHTADIHLLIYCKFKFSSFHASWDEYEQVRKSTKTAAKRKKEKGKMDKERQKQRERRRERQKEKRKELERIEQQRRDQSQKKTRKRKKR